MFIALVIVTIISSGVCVYYSIVPPGRRGHLGRAGGLGHLAYFPIEVIFIPFYDISCSDILLVLFWSTIFKNKKQNKKCIGCIKIAQGAENKMSQMEMFLKLKVSD